MAAIKPLLIISDSVSAPTGLARIARDLAIRIHANLGDVYRLATFGFGAPGDRRLGFQQYVAEGVDEFCLPQISDVWNNFAGEEQGAVLCIWDPSRLGWLAQPQSNETLMNPRYRGLREWLMKRPFHSWIYCPLDASGPEDRLTFSLMKTLHGFDRILAYSEWGREVIERTISTEEANKRHLFALPHGIDSEVFSESPDRMMCRSVFSRLTGALPIGGDNPWIADDEVLIGIVATNQSRKDWALGIETVALLAKQKKVRLWIHTDTTSRNWDIYGLLIDHGLFSPTTLLSKGYISDDAMADAYSACDVTLGIGPEGFGYPIFESVFCGTPCVIGNYGGAPEHLWPEVLVEPREFRYEGLHSQKRPVYRAQDFVDKILPIIGKRLNRPGALDWPNLWPHWEAWFREAAKDLEV